MSVTCTTGDFNISVMKIAYIAGINESAPLFRVSTKGVMIDVSKAVVIQRKAVFFM
jgi:hypothetical protein